MCAFSVPIVVVLTRHQQKMTQLLHQNPGPPPSQTVQVHPAHSAEIAALRDLIAQQAIAIDNLQQSTDRLHKRLDDQSALEQRING